MEKSQVKPVPLKKSSKQERERKILIGLVEQYIKTAKPVGSSTLQDAGFQDLSSATIRNYFAQLEEEGFLKQQHASGGRTPTEKAFRVYAEHCLDVVEHEKEQLLLPQIEEARAIKEVITFLQNMMHITSDLTNTPVFISAPRFDRDFVLDMRLVPIDHARALVVIITNFGLVFPEIVAINHKLSSFSVKRIEEYFQARLKNQEIDHAAFTGEEEDLARTLYQEAMTRYIVSYANFTQEDVWRAGFSKLLFYPEFQEAHLLAASLALFENAGAQRALVRECIKARKMKCLIGDDLLVYCPTTPNCTVVLYPYFIGQKAAGALGIIGPLRMPYQHVFQVLKQVTDKISSSLTSNLQKYAISFRGPSSLALEQGKRLLEGPKHLLLEKSESKKRK